MWGLWHGFFIIIEKISAHFIQLPSCLSNTIGRIYTLFIVVIGWVFFRSETLDYARQYLKVMFGLLPTNPDFGIGYYVQTGGWVVFVLGAFAATAGSRNMLKKHCLAVNVGIDVFLLTTLVATIVLLTASSYNPFIYFRF